MASLALLATLVGVFVTPSGIVVAADTAQVLDTPAVTIGTEIRPSSRTFSVTRKIQPCGPRSVAALTNTSGLQGSSDGGITSFRVLDFHPIVTRTCRAFPIGSGVTIQQQAQQIAKDVSGEAERRIPLVLRTSLEASLGFTQVIVAGYDGATPVIAVARVALTRERKFGWTDARVYPDCIIFAGQIGAATALTSATDERTAALSKRPAVAASIAARKSKAPCSSMTEAHAEEVFGLAVELSLDSAAKFKIEPGLINWPLEFITIRRTGPQPLRRVEKPQKTGSAPRG